MLETQKNFIQYEKNIQQEISKNKSLKEQISSLPLLSIDDLIETIKEQELLVPVIGTFSAGKTTLLNSFLQKDTLPVAITPETSLATELRFSEHEKGEAVTKGYDIVDFSLSEINIIKEHAREYRNCKVFLNAFCLRDIEPIVLVDMPGFDSPVDIHNMAILSYIQKGVHFILLTSVEEGNVTRSIMRQLHDIEEMNRKFSSLLSKKNLRSNEEVSRVKERIDDQLTIEFSSNINTLPVGKDGGQDLDALIKSIDPEKLFYSLFRDALVTQYDEIMQIINVRVSVLKQDTEKSKQIITELKSALEITEKKKDNIMHQAKEQYSTSSIDSISSKAAFALSRSIDELTDTAINNGQEQLNARIIEIVRSSLISETNTALGEIGDDIASSFQVELASISGGIGDFFNNPEWLDNISIKAKDIFSGSVASLRNLTTKTADSILTKNGGAAISKVIAGTLIAIPEVVSTIIGAILMFLPEILSFFGKRLEEKNKAQTRENVKSQILTLVIPQVKSKIRQEILPPIMAEQVEGVITQIAEGFEGELSQQRKSIEKAEEERTQKQGDIEAEIEQYTEIRNNITSLANDTLYKG